MPKKRRRKARRPTPSQPPGAIGDALASPGAPGRKLGRNERCWCGSGLKYKRCHLDEDAGDASGDPPGGRATMNQHLITLVNLVEEVHGEASPAEQEWLLHQAGAAWNLSRTVDSPESLEVAIAQRCAEVFPASAGEEDLESYRLLMQDLVAAARRIAPEDRRLVQRVEVVDAPNGRVLEVESVEPQDGGDWF